jgi:hypothetical protein
MEFFDTLFIQWLQRHQELLFPLIISIGILKWFSNLIQQNIKVVEFLFPPRQGQILKKIELLKTSKDFSDEVAQEIIEEQIKDEIFIESSGLFFRGRKRKLFNKVYGTLKEMFELYELKLIQSYLIERDNKLQMTSRVRTLGELLFLIILFGLLGLLFILLIALSFTNNHPDWVRFILFLLLSVDLAIILIQVKKISICGRLRTILNKRTA